MYISLMPRGSRSFTACRKKKNRPAKKGFQEGNNKRDKKAKIYRQPGGNKGKKNFAR